jgi:hypothetical protein
MKKKRGEEKMLRIKKEKKFKHKKKLQINNYKLHKRIKTDLIKNQINRISS